VKNFAIIIHYNDEKWDGESLMNAVEICDSSFSGMGGISVVFNQLKHSVNIAVNNSLFYKLTNKVLELDTRLATQIKIEHCTFILNRCMAHATMIKI